MTLSWISGQRQVLAQRQASLRKQIEQTELQMFAATKDDELTLRAQERAYAVVQRHQAEIGSLQENKDALELTIADSNVFIAGLEQKLNALSDATLVAKHLGDVQFESCPACFAPIGESSAGYACHLCKSPFDNERVRERMVALINDTAIQLKQSRTLQGRRDNELTRLSAQLAIESEAWRVASARLTEVRHLPSTEVQEALRELHRQAGYLEREIEDLERQADMVRLVDDLSKKKADLNAEIARLKADNEARAAEQERRLRAAYTAIADEVRELLKKDLRRQDSFENPQSIQFDFALNSITVDGSSYFSASSRAILKSAFFVGFLAASLKQSFFRHPRFAMLDTIEDKGMEAGRSQNFQRLIAAISEGANVEHQIIFATAMIAPELNKPQYTVGKVSTRDDPTLAVVS
jgi:DNA repair exonuclease SbcCD ATPase subunit